MSDRGGFVSPSKLFPEIKENMNYIHVWICKQDERIIRQVPKLLCDADYEVDRGLGLGYEY